MLPDHADFFINMEKLMLLQVNEALENPNAESIIIVETEQFHTPVPKAKPFHLFCDRGYKAHVDQDLCPKPSSTSSTSKLPVIIINKRCVYAACDNFEQFTDKTKEFVYGNSGDDADINDDVTYEHCVPVKYTSSQQLFELKLQSSLLQVLQQEMSNIRKVLTVEQDSKKSIVSNEKIIEQEPPPFRSRNKATNAAAVTIDKRLEHEKEPKMDSYIRYIKPKKCECAKTAKKHLVEHLPVYMRNMSEYEALELPNYEKCSVATLKKLVKQTRGQTTPPILIIPSKTRNMGTQYSNDDFGLLCTCLSGSKTDVLFNDPINVPKLFEASRYDQFCLGAGSPSYMTTQWSSFAIDRAHSLRRLIDDSPELLDIFNKKEDC